MQQQTFKPENLPSSLTGSLSRWRLSVVKKIRILSEQDRPLRFLMSRIMARSTLARWNKIKFDRPGYRLYLQPAALSMSLWEDPHDRSSDSRVIRTLLKPGDCFIDVGANIGHLTIEAALRVGLSGAVYAFEAHPRTYSFLRENVALNQLVNVRTAQIALGDSMGWVGFDDQRSDDQNAVATNVSALWVPMATLDALCADLSPALLKIDVEGFEVYVLRGAPNLMRRVECIYFEADERNFSKYGYRFADLWDLLTTAGFRIAREDTQEGFIELGRNYECRECVNLLAVKNFEFLRPLKHQ